MAEVHDRRGQMFWIGFPGESLNSITSSRQDFKMHKCPHHFYPSNVADDCLKTIKLSKIDLKRMDRKKNAKENSKVRSTDAEIKQCSYENKPKNRNDHLQYRVNLWIKSFHCHYEIFGRIIPCLFHTGRDIWIVAAKYGNFGLKLKKFESNIVSANVKGVFVLGLTKLINMSNQTFTFQER